jgi:hypothetical protein
MVRQCRSCDGRDLKSIGDGRLVVCAACLLVQAKERLTADRLFSDYALCSSHSPERLAHAARLADEILPAKGLVVEIGSNDGYLLRLLADDGAEVLGVDPARLPARAAREAGLPVMQGFFGRDLAETIAARGQSASVVLLLDTLDRAVDPDDMAAGLARILATDGEVVIDFGYVVDLAEGGALEDLPKDQVLCFSLRALRTLLERHGLHLNNARRLPGSGALRVNASVAKTCSPALEALLAAETALALDDPLYYETGATPHRGHPRPPASMPAT